MLAFIQDFRSGFQDNLIKKKNYIGLYKGDFKSYCANHISSFWHVNKVVKFTSLIWGEKTRSTPHTINCGIVKNSFHYSQVIVVNEIIFIENVYYMPGRQKNMSSESHMMHRMSEVLITIVHLEQSFFKRTSISNLCILHLAISLKLL